MIVSAKGFPPSGDNLKSSSGLSICRVDFVSPVPQFVLSTKWESYTCSFQKTAICQGGSSYPTFLHCIMPTSYPALTHPNISRLGKQFPTTFFSPRPNWIAFSAHHSRRFYVPEISRDSIHTLQYLCGVDIRPSFREG